MPPTKGSFTAAGSELPRVIVFDLDGTLWNPEMYQLGYGGGSPFKLQPSDPNCAVDRAGTKVKLIGESRAVLQAFLTDPAFQGVHLAISSTCDEPDWAQELLQLFTFKDAAGHTCSMKSLFRDNIHIYYANKAAHHRELLKCISREEPSVTGMSDFLFFDNQRNNIADVSRIGVTSAYCPNGMTPGTFERGIQQWRSERKKQ